MLARIWSGRDEERGPEAKAESVDGHARNTSPDAYRALWASARLLPARRHLSGGAKPVSPRRSRRRRSRSIARSGASPPPFLFYLTSPISRSWDRARKFSCASAAIRSLFGPIAGTRPRGERRRAISAGRRITCRSEGACGHIDAGATSRGTIWGASRCAAPGGI